MCPQASFNGVAHLGGTTPRHPKSRQATSGFSDFLLNSPVSSATRVDRLVPRWRPVHRRYIGLAMSDKNVAAKLFCAEDVELKRYALHKRYSKMYIIKFTRIISGHVCFSITVYVRWNNLILPYALLDERYCIDVYQCLAMFKCVCSSKMCVFLF